jgi:hypothetical protein
VARRWSPRARCPSWTPGQTRRASSSRPITSGVRELGS